MLYFIIGLLFGFIFGWLLRFWQESRVPHAVDAQQFNRERLANEQLHPLLNDASADADGETAELDQMRAEGERLRMELGNSQEQMRELQATIEQRDSERQALMRQLDEFSGQAGRVDEARAELESMQQAIAERERAIGDLQARLQALESQAANAAEVEHDLDDELQRVQAELAACRERSETLQSEVENRQSALAAAEARVQSLQSEFDAQQSHIADLQAQLAQQTDLQEEELDVEALKASLPKAVGGPDDLKKIKGIGQVLEKTLNELGISTFRQIALLDETHMRQVERALKTFPDRMQRDDWIGQARELHRRHYGEAL